MMSGWGGLVDVGKQAGQNFWGGVPGVLQGLFGDSGKPYEKANEAYQPYYTEAKGYQEPYLKAGNTAIGDFQGWLSGQKDPSQFINHLMSMYQESPHATYLKQQAERAGTNAASAGGLIGSSPYAQQLQQNAANISSEDLNGWLQKVLGINTNYGAGQQYLMGQGANSANSLSKLANEFGQFNAATAYGQEAGKQQDKNALWGGIAKMFGG